ncbi:MAG: class IV adenylate cyclase [Thermoplasmatota archaeon]
MDGHEVEVKAVLLKTSDPDEALEFARTADARLKEGGARFKYMASQDDTYLSHPSRDFSRTDEALRVRTEEREGEFAVKMTYKGPKVSELSKARLEKEVGITGGSRDEILQILSHLGFNEVMTVRKVRRTFDLDGIEVDLDIVEKLGVFCEMELFSEDVREAERRIIEAMDSLGFNRFERRSYLELLLSKQF